jgi:hypothetical protein
MSNTADATSVAGTAYPSKAPEFTARFRYSFVVFCVGFFLLIDVCLFLISFFAMFLTQNFDS